MAAPAFSPGTAVTLSRLGGALLLQVAESFFLIGNLKRPCDFAAAGFVPRRNPSTLWRAQSCRSCAQAPLPSPVPFSI